MVSKFIKCICQELNKRWASNHRHISETGFETGLFQGRPAWVTQGIVDLSSLNLAYLHRLGKHDYSYFHELSDLEVDFHSNIGIQILLSGSTISMATFWWTRDGWFWVVWDPHLRQQKKSLSDHRYRCNFEESSSCCLFQWYVSLFRH